MGMNGFNLKFYIKEIENIFSCVPTQLQKKVYSLRRFLNTVFSLISIIYLYNIYIPLTWT